MTTRFSVHFDSRAVDELCDRLVGLPRPFFFGAATAGYQIEGGYNRAGEPQTNWANWERSGKVEPSGDACRFFDFAAADTRTMRRMGLSMSRMSVEWARIQPSTLTTEHPDAPPEFDEDALRRYARILAGLFDAGIEPCVTLHHFVHPLWAGLDFWLHRDRVEGLFIPYVSHTVQRLNCLLVEELHQRPIRYWITLNEINLLAGGLHGLGWMPHQTKPSLPNMRTALQNLGLAHCLAYQTIHAVYARNAWPKPSVSLNTFSSAPYSMEKMLHDIFLARESGVARDALPAYLADSRQAWRADMARIAGPRLGWDCLRNGLAFVADRALDQVLSPARLERLIGDVYACASSSLVDFIAVDYYDPFVRSQLGSPDADTRKPGDGVRIITDLWNNTLNPTGLRAFLHAYARGSYGKPMLVAESGMCHKHLAGVTYPRRDQATRDVFLKAYLFEVLRALQDGLPVIGYLHWSLCDNYEWGSFAPRFGLLATDYSDGSRRRSLDAFGVNAAGAYALLVAAIATGDAREVRAALSASSYPLISVD